MKLSNGIEIRQAESAEQLRRYLRVTAGIDDRQMERIMSCFQFRSIKKHTVLLSEGELCKEFYFVHKGCIRTYYITNQGQEKTRYIAFENSVATSIASFISQEKSLEFVSTLEDAELSVISHKDFYQLVYDTPQWEKFYRTLLETAYLFQHKKIESLVTLSAKERYKRLMIETPGYIQRLSNKILASYLDITQETLSRIKSK